MVAENPNPEGETTRGGGELLSDPERYRSDARMITRAIREGWKLRPQLFDVLPDEATKIALNKLPDGNYENHVGVRLGAMKLLVSMNGQNQADEHKDKPDLHHHIVEERIDADYAEYCLQRELAACPERAGDVCQLGEPRPVEGGPAPGEAKPSTNGHSNGHA